jgi:hypothetical protein
MCKLPIIILSYILFVLQVARPAAAQSPNPDLKVSAVQYNVSSVPAQYRGRLVQWLPSHFNLLIGDRIDLSAHARNMWWSAYMDGGGITAPAMYDYIHDVAAQRSWNYENMFLHFNVDYTASGGVRGATVWSGMDQFDIWEQVGGANGQGIGSPKNSVNGAFVYDHSYDDVTVRLYQGTCGRDCRIKNMLYLGYAEPFALINVTVATGRDGGTATWQYWNGSAWSSLTLGSDSTNGIANTGAVQFTPPPNWAPNVVNHSRSKYWVRLVIAEAKTAPLLSQVYGDDWISHSGDNNLRGWNATDPNRKNQGRGNLEYNPAPPANASAHFRYQARVTGYWNHNYLFTNPGDIQGGKITFVDALLAHWVNDRRHDGLKYNALMFDNVGNHVNPASPHWNENLTDLPCSPHCQPGALEGYVKAMMESVAPQIKALPGNGSAFVVGGNVGNMTLKGAFDMLFFEFTYLSVLDGNISSQFPKFDALLAANNPSGTRGSFAGWDNQHFGYSLTQAGDVTRHVWDNANRTPMATLATYYMAANANTMFLYNSQGWSYFDTDEYYYWARKTATLSSPLSADPSTAAKTIRLNDGKHFTVPGGPIWTRATDYVLQIGGQDVVHASRTDDATFVTQTPVVNTYPAGATVRYALVGHHSVDRSPRWQDVWYYANWFPAMLVDIGTPDANGWHKGTRDTAYLTGTAASSQPSCHQPGGGLQCAEVWRRDFTNAIILDRVMHDSTLAGELELAGPAISLVDPSHKLDGPYYQLYSDGTTGPPITSVTLRAGEAAILMKHPAASDK